MQRIRIANAKTVYSSPGERFGQQNPMTGSQLQQQGLVWDAERERSQPEHPNLPKGPGTSRGTMRAQRAGSFYKATGEEAGTDQAVCSQLAELLAAGHPGTQTPLQPLPT